MNKVLRSVLVVAGLSSLGVADARALDVAGNLMNYCLNTGSFMSAFTGRSWPVESWNRFLQFSH